MPVKKSTTSDAPVYEKIGTNLKARITTNSAGVRFMNIRYPLDVEGEASQSGRSNIIAKTDVKFFNLKDMGFEADGLSLYHTRKLKRVRDEDAEPAPRKKVASTSGKEKPSAKPAKAIMRRRQRDDDE